MSTAPWTFAEATERINRYGHAQEQAEHALRDAARKNAEAERAYREALAARIVHEHADGRAWTVCGDLARGDKTVAHLKMERDVAAGVHEAMQHAVFRAAADRRDCSRLVEWSQRRDLAENGGGLPQWTQPHAGVGA